MLFDVSKPNEVSQKQKQINEKKFTSWAEAYFSSQNYKQTNNQKLNQGCTVLKTHFQRVCHCRLFEGTSLFEGN